MKMVLVFLMLFHGHQESAQFNIVSVLLNIIFKHNLKKLLKFLDFFLFNVKGKTTIVKLQNGYKNFLSYFELCGKGYQNFLKDHVGVPSVLVPGIKNDYSLTIRDSLCKYNQKVELIFLYLLKMSEYLCFSDVFRDIEMIYRPGMG